MHEIELSIVMPCLNEAETLRSCIEKAQQAIKELSITAEIVIGDNGSTDGSIEIAQELGANVVHVATKGYGAAISNACRKAKGRYIIMADSDESYDFLNIEPFVEKLRAGADLVMGNRFLGGIQPGAMPWKNRYIGNPILSFLGRFLFTSAIGDFHCGMRGFSKAAFEKMALRTTGMEFASEMVVKAAVLDMRIEEVPCILYPDGRSRKPHLRPWRDGWRHLRFLLLFSPRWLFLYPGLALTCFGLFLLIWLLPGPRTIGPIRLDIHSMLFGVGFLLTGVQALSLGALARIAAVSLGLLPKRPGLDELLDAIRFEHVLLFGMFLCLGGVVGAINALITWASLSFGDLEGSATLRLAMLSVSLLILGAQMILSSFFFGLLEFRTTIDSTENST